MRISRAHIGQRDDSMVERWATHEKWASNPCHDSLPGEYGLLTLIQAKGERLFPTPRSS